MTARKSDTLPREPDPPPTRPGHAACETDQLRKVRRFGIATRLRWYVAAAYVVILTLVYPLLALVGLLAGILLAVLIVLVHAFDEADTRPTIAICCLLIWVALFITPVLLSLPVLLSGALFWRRPRRIIVFRRFNVARKNAVPKRLLTRCLAPFGHVFTLADRRIHMPWYVRIPVLLGQLSFVHFRPHVVDSERQLKKLQRRLDNRRWLNVNWLVSFRKIFPIRTSDNYWKACVHVLLDQADLAVIDISTPGDALLWESKECIQHNLRARTLFLVSETAEDVSRRWIAHVAKRVPAIASIPIFTYGRRGLTDRGSFRTHAMRLLVEPVGPVAAVHYASMAGRFAVTLAMTIAIVTGGLLISAPYLFGGLTVRYSPWPWPLYQVYLYSGQGDAALARLERDFRDSMIPKLHEWTRSWSAFKRKKGFTALGRVGDERAIRPLFALVESGGWERDQPAAEALHAVVKRVGAPALSEYLLVLRTTQNLPFDKECYERLESSFLAMDADGFNEMLESPSPAARFTATLRLAKENDLRIVPALIEMLRYEAPTPLLAFLRGKAREHLSRLVKEGRGNLDLRTLDRYLSDHDAASAYAARFVLAYTSDDDLRARLRAARPGDGRALVSELVQRAAKRGTKESTRAAELLTSADSAWLQAALVDSDRVSCLDAALLLAMRGDPSGLAPTLDLLRIKTGNSPDSSFTFEDRGIQIIDYLAETVAPSRTFPVPLDHLDEIPIKAVVRLASAVARTQDDVAIIELIQAYAGHPKADRTGSWEFYWDDIGASMAKTIPDRLLNEWLLQAATTEGDASKRQALTVLARKMIQQQVGRIQSLDSDDLAEMALRWLSQ